MGTKRAAQNDEQSEALKRERLRHAAQQKKLWVGEDYLFRYQTEDGIGLGQIVCSRRGSLEWDAYDLQLTEGNGALFIGHFQGEKLARKAVEDYWSMMG